MKVNGGCHCGAITYEADVDPNMVGVCHCTDCQTLTGSAFRANVQAPAASFKISGAAPKTYLKTTAASGNKRVHAFCPECGTPLYACAPENPTTYSLRVGGIKQNKQFGPPIAQLWCESALPWSMNLEGVPKRAQQ